MHACPIDTNHMHLSATAISSTRPHPLPPCARTPSALLLADTDRPAPPPGRLAVLAAHAQAPVVPQAAVRADLLEALEVLAQLRVDAVGEDLLVLARHDVALPVEEPGRDLVLRRVLDDGDDALEFFGGEFAGAGGGDGLVLWRRVGG